MTDPIYCTFNGTPPPAFDQQAIQAMKQDPHWRALWAYAAMMNTQDLAHLEPYLAEEFSYGSQMVMAPDLDRDGFLKWMLGRFRVNREQGYEVRADLAWVPPDVGAHMRCVLVCVPTPQDRHGVGLADMRDDRLVRWTPSAHV